MKNQYIIVYDEEGTVINQYSADSINPPVGIPYIIVDILSPADKDYRPVIAVDISTIPHQPIYGKTREEEQLEFYSLEAHKKYLIDKSKKDLETYLETYPLASTAHGGIEGIYSVTLEKQNMMTSNYLSWKLETQINPNAILTWNETGKKYEEWTEEEFLQLVLEIKNYVKPKIEMQQSYEEMINNATSKDEINNITFPRYEELW